MTALALGACLHTRSAGVLYFGAGSIVCALTAKVVKRVIRQGRPVHGKKASYGCVLHTGYDNPLTFDSMPSTHSASCTFFAAYATLASLYLPVHPRLHPVTKYAPLMMVPWAALIVSSRVWLGYHTWPQVAVGTALGILWAAVWFKLWIEDAGGVRTLGGILEGCFVMSRVTDA